MSDELGDLRATCRANARKISFLEAENWRLREQIADFTIELERRGDALVAASERIQNLEAALAAVPVDAISSLYYAAERHLSDFHHRHDAADIRRWAEQRRQP